MEKEILKLLRKNAIEKCNESVNRFVSPIFLVPKPDGSSGLV